MHDEFTTINKSTSKLKKTNRTKYIDPFTQHEIQKQSKRQRIINDKRQSIARALNENGNDEQIDHSNLNQNEGFLGLSSNAKSDIVKTHLAESSKRLKLNSSTTSITTSNVDIFPNRNISGSSNSTDNHEHNPDIASSQKLKHLQPRLHFKYNHLNDLISHPSKISLPISYHLKENLERAVNWFKNNRYEYTIVNENLDKLKDEILSGLMMPARKPNLNSSLENMLENSKKQSLQNTTLLQEIISQKYVPQAYRRNKSDPTPTHLVESTRKVGIYMVYAFVKEIRSKESYDVILLKMDNMVRLDSQDLIVLSKLPSTSIEIEPGIDVPVYSKFQVYIKTPLEC